MSIPSYRQHRYPAEIIAQCVRHYFRFPLSYRGVEEMMFERGVIVSYETIRRWCHKFGSFIAAEIRCSGRHRLPAHYYRKVLAAWFMTWHEVTGVAA